MAEKRTEALHEHAGGLDQQPPAVVLGFLADAQIQAAQAVRGAIGSIADAAKIVAGTLGAGGRLAYAAAGSSGLMALADALELPGTYGIPRERIVVFFAGGAAALRDMAGAPEDDSTGAAREVADRRAIRKALTRTENNISGAAKLLGISRPTLYDLMKQYRLQA